MDGKIASVVFILDGDIYDSASTYFMLKDTKRESFRYDGDDFWTYANAYVNGEKADILRVDEGLMAVLCPAGASSIDFVYQAAGLSASRMVTAVAIPVWVVYVAYFVRRKRRSTGVPAEE